MDFVLIAILCGLLAVLYGLLTTRQVLAAPAGNPRMQEIAAAIQEGAGAYLRKQYSAIAVVGVVALVLVYLFFGIHPAIGFLIGALLSGVTGFIGMNISVRANVRTAEAARQGLQAGLTLAFRAGAVTGLLVAGLALLAIAGYFFVLTRQLGFAVDDRVVIDSLVSLALGASLIVESLIQPQAYADAGLDVARARREAAGNAHFHSMIRSSCTHLMEFLDEVGLLTKPALRFYRKAHMI